VRHGVDERLGLEINEQTGRTYSTNTFIQVHCEMLFQICRDYSSLPDFRSLTASEIRFFYEGLRNELKQGSKPRNKNGG